MLSFASRIYSVLHPPNIPKEANPVRFGIIGAARIAPIALILAVASHSEAIVLGVAARDEKRAKAFAKKHKIAKVYYGHTGYQDLINDPEIDAIYNPLPNGLHFEWTAKALEAGKHVLLEKPSTNTAEETRRLFEIATQKNVILLEAFHYRFHPAFIRLTEIVQSGELGRIQAVKSELKVPRGFVPDSDIRLDYSLGGGGLMDMGTYPISVARTLIGTEPTSVTITNHVLHPNDSTVDRDVDFLYAFPEGATAEMGCDLQMSPRFGFIPRWPLNYIKVRLEDGEVSLSNFPAPYIFHSITVKPKLGNQRTETAYRYENGKGEQWWTTYRYQLEAFVDKVKGRIPKTWISPEDSVNQMKAIEMVYNKLGLPLRPTSKYTIPSSEQ